MTSSDNNSRYIQLFSVSLLAAILTIGGLSVSGLLQSTNKIGSSGVVIRPTPPPIIIGGGGGGSTPPPPPEPLIEITVFSDPDCNLPLSTISWGEIEIGSSSSRAIYIKNTGDVDVLLSLSSDNWNPLEVQDKMSLTWDYDGSVINPNEVIRVELKLQIDESCPELSSFYFEVVIIAT